MQALRLDACDPAWCAGWRAAASLSRLRADLWGAGAALRAAHRDLVERLRAAADAVEAGVAPDVIEMDEIYTFVQKGSAGVQKGSAGPWCGLLTHDGRLAWLPLPSAIKA